MRILIFLTREPATSYKMLKALILTTLISSSLARSRECDEECQLPNWDVPDKDLMMKGIWHGHMCHVNGWWADDFDTDCCRETITRDPNNPRKWHSYYQARDNKGITRGDKYIGFSPAADSGILSCTPCVGKRLRMSLICGQTKGPNRIRGIIACDNKSKKKSFWIQLENRRSYPDNPPTRDEQIKINRCIRKSGFKLSDMTYVNNTKC